MIVSNIDRIRSMAFEYSGDGIVITDPTLEDNPIIDANPAFEEMTGYKVEEIIGQNCRFLQRGQADSVTVDRLRYAIEHREHITVVLRNYRKDGTLFLNELSVSPVYNREGQLTNFIGIQHDVSEREDLRDLLHLGKSERAGLFDDAAHQARRRQHLDDRITELLRQANIK